MNETILLVDDNPRLVAGMQLALELNGYAVVTAKNGIDALAMLRENQPDLILCDILMPGMDGFDFLKSLRTRPDWIKIPFVFLTALADEHSIMTSRTLGADEYLCKPVSTHTLLQVVRARLDRATALDATCTRTAYLRSMMLVAGIVEMRDGYTADHIERVGMYCHALARALDWDEHEAEDARIAGILHDIGKLAISDQILGKVGPLTEAEWKEMKQHPETGAAALGMMENAERIIAGVRHHHEAYDGSGYPDGLARDEIPVLARILAIVDAFDAMTTDRPYRKALTPNVALMRLAQNAGSQFDPRIVETFIEIWHTLADKMNSAPADALGTTRAKLEQLPVAHPALA
jgi:putative two-component system response regulator